MRGQFPGSGIITSDQGQLTSGASQTKRYRYAWRVVVLPADGLGLRGVSLYIAAEFTGQVWHGSKHAARDDITLDPGKPDLDLIVLCADRLSRIM
jgi:hypothetical protein